MNVQMRQDRRQQKPDEVDDDERRPTTPTDPDEYVRQVLAEANEWLRRHGVQP